MHLIEFVTEERRIDPDGMPIESNCIDITFFNYGQQSLLVNDTIVVPPPSVAGQFTFFEITANIGEINRTNYNVQFTGAGTKVAIVVWRKYKNER